MNIKVLSTKKVEAGGYEVRKELVKFEQDKETVTLYSAYNLAGKYIGTAKDAARLWNKWGIKPETIDPDDDTCSIGFSEKNQKWYGWSHRAIHGFGVGDQVEEGDLTAQSQWSPMLLEENPEADRSLPVGFVAKTLDDCKKMAIAFADAVS